MGRTRVRGGEGPGAEWARLRIRADNRRWGDRCTVGVTEVERGGAKFLVGIFTQRALKGDGELQALVRNTHVANEKVMGWVRETAVRAGELSLSRVNHNNI